MGDEQLVESMQNKNLKDKIKITVLCLIFITITISFVFNGLPLSRLHKIHANYKTSNNLKRWAYLIGEGKYSDSFISYLNKAFSKLDVVSVTGFRLNSRGKLLILIKDRSYNAILSNAKRYNVKVYPLITFRSTTDGKKLLSNFNARKTAIIQIKRLCIDSSFQGIHIDFEYLPPDYAIKLSTFLKELHSAIGKRKLTMAIFPQVEFPYRYYGFHNLKLISSSLDEVVLMCYDYHRPGTKAGPVTDLKWAEKNIIRVLKYLNPDHVWLGVPAYGYAWDEDGRTSIITERRGLKIAKKFDWIRHRSGTIFIEQRYKGKLRQIYFSDSLTRKAMSDLAAKYKLKGTALWRLGFEEE